MNSGFESSCVIIALSPSLSLFCSFSFSMFRLLKRVEASRNNEENRAVYCCCLMAPSSFNARVKCRTRGVQGNLE